MKKRNLFFTWLTLLLIMFSFTAIAQTPGYQMKLTNAAQVSCNVYEFDVTLNSTQPTNLLKLANFQVGILINPGIVPVGASIQIALVPGSSNLPNPQQNPGPEKFLYNPTTNCIQVAPVVPVGSASASSITMTGYKLFRLRVSSSMPFVIGTAPDHTWNFTLADGYPTKVFGYIGTVNTDVTNQASHLLVAPDNPVMMGGYPDPIAQEVTADVTSFCNIPGQGAQISLTSTQPGYSYYLYSDGVMVPGTEGVLFGTGSMGTFAHIATGNVMSVKSVGCLGDVNMLNTVSLLPIPPVAVTIDIEALPGTIVLPGTMVTYTAVSTNQGIDPFYIWHVNGIPDYNTFAPTYQYIPAQGDQIYCMLYPSAEVCTPDLEVMSNTLMMSINELYTVTGGGTICEGTETEIMLSGSNMGITYDLFKDGIDYGMPLPGTGMPITWMVSEAGMYTVQASGLLMAGNAFVTVDPLPAAAGLITGTMNVLEGTNNVLYSVDPILFADTYEWAYSGTGVTINGNGSPVVSLNFAYGATSGQLTVKGMNYCGYGIDSFFDVFVDPLPPCDPPINPEVLSVTSNSAVLDWTGGTMWNVKVGPPGFDPVIDSFFDVYGVINKPLTVDGLAPFTDYEFYVQNDCGFVNPKTDNFWMAMSSPGMLEPLLSGGTADDPGETGIWYYYNQAPSQPWWNIWFYNDPPDPNRLKKVRMGFWVQPLLPGLPSSINYVINWSTLDWNPPVPGFPLPSDEIFIERSPVNGPMVIDAPQWVEIYYVIEDYNPEWISVDIWGENIIILDAPTAPPAGSPLLSYWNPGMIGGTIVHECLPKTTGSGWTGPKPIKTCQDYLIPIQIEICDNELPYSWEGMILNTGGTYQVSYPTTNPPGCDSTIVLTLIVHPTEYYLTEDTICQGDIYVWMGNNYTTAGQYFEYGTTANGCLITYELDLTVNPVGYELTVAEICEGDVYVWRGNNYTVAGTYFDYGLTVDGCLFTYELQLTVNPLGYELTEAEICEGQFYTWRGNDFTATGTYFDYGMTVDGCTFTYELQLTVNPRPEAKISLNGVELPPVINAVTDLCIDNSLILTLTGMTYGTPPLTFNYTLNNVAQTVTVGIGDNLYSELAPLTPGTYEIIMTSITDAKGCSVHPMALPYYNHTFIVHPNEYYLTTAEICEGDVFVWMGNNYSAAGSYLEYGQTAEGCLITYELQLTVNPLGYELTEAEICDGDVYVWRGNNYSVAGTYFDYGMTVDGCTFTYELQLTVNPLGYELTEAEICEGDVYVWRGNNYTTAGTYFDYGLTVDGCLFTYELHLTVNPLGYELTEAEICEGEVYTWMGNSYTAPGTYYEYGQTAFGCNMTYELNLIVHPTYYIVENVNIYDYQTPYLWQGNSYSASGTYYANYQTSEGCDSIYELNLVVKAFIPLYVTKNIGSAVQANWDEIPGASLYQLRYRELPSGIWIYVTQSTQLFRKISGLTPGTQYELQLRHKVGFVWQLWNSAYAPITFTTNVIDFASTYDIGTKFRIEWTPIDDISSYILQYKKSTDATWMTKGYYTVNYAVMNPMDENTSYDYRVCPRYDEVSFHWTAPGTITSNYINIYVSDYTGTSANFSWDPVVNPNATSYGLQIREIGMVATMSYASTTTQRTVTNLNAALSYEYRLVVLYSGVSWGATSWRPLTGSKEESLVLQPMNDLNVYPNPVGDFLTVEISSTADATHIWNLYDVNGKLVMSGTNSLTSGLNYMQIETGHLSTGLYMLQSNFNGMMRTSRIIKQ